MNIEILERKASSAREARRGPLLSLTGNFRQGRKLLAITAAATLALTAHGQRKPDVHIWVAKDVAPSSKVRLTINTQNVETVHMTAFRVNAEKWLSVSHKETDRPQAVGSPVRSWDVGVRDKGQYNPRQADQFYSRQVNLPKLSPGVYLVFASGGGKSVSAVVNVTNLAVIVKESSSKLLVWVTDALTGRIERDAEVSVYRKGTAIGRYRTGPDGAVFENFTSGDNHVVVRKGADVAGIGSNAPEQAHAIRPHFQTDRSIYRPGQTVFFKGLFRRESGADYVIPPGQEVSVELRDPKNTPLDVRHLRLNAMGSVNDRFDIPSEGATGAYTLMFTIGRDQFYHTFTVAAYRKPEYKVDVTPEAKRFLSGEKVRFKVSAQYFFGSPVQNAEVHYLVRQSPLAFYSESDEGGFYGGDGNLYARDTYNYNTPVADDVAHTDKDGNVVIEVNSDPKAGDVTYSIDCTVTDNSRRQVTGSASVSIFTANLRVGLSSKLDFVQLGKLIPIDIRVVDLEGMPASSSVTLKLYQPIWNEKTNAYENKLLTSTSAKVVNGKASVTLPASAEGELVLTAEAPDGTGRTAHASLGLYVAEANYTEPKQEVAPQVGIKLDRRTYEPGMDANIFASSNKPQTPILAVLEGEELWGYSVRKANSVWTVRLDKRYSPNAYVTVQQWVKGQLVSGTQVLPIPDKSRKIAVTVTPDKQTYEPGDKATFTVDTKDSSGKPVAAEVALSVVDEAIFAMSGDNTADLYQTFWGMRQNQVVTEVSAPEELSGGAYQRVNTVAPVRQRFEDTAYWNATLATGPDGHGSATFEVPGNLTTWRATARGITAQTSVGMDVSKVVATRQVTMRLATPRQMVQGDKLRLIATVNNRTAETHKFHARIVAQGIASEGQTEQDFSLDGKSTQTLTFDLDASKLTGEPALLTAEVYATDVPEAERSHFGDALEMKVPLAPNGVAHRLLLGGPVSDAVSASFEIPADAVSYGSPLLHSGGGEGAGGEVPRAPANTTTITIWAGLAPIIEEDATNVMNTYRYSASIGADQLEVAAARHMGAGDKTVREAIAMISRTQADGGWGWWDGSHPDVVVTQRVLVALEAANAAHLGVPDALLASARGAAQNMYNQTNLWEYKALLASALVDSKPKDVPAMLDDVVARGINLSPYSRLRIAESYSRLGKSEASGKMLDAVLQDLNEAPTTAYIPTGDGIGWSESEQGTTAELLKVLLLTDTHSELQPKLVQWIIGPEVHEWCSEQNRADNVQALSAYDAKYPSARELGSVNVTINGAKLEVTKSPIAERVTGKVPPAMLKLGPNELHVTRSGGGQAFYQIDSTSFRPTLEETESGVRVVRRFEVKNDAGVWVELNRTLKPNEPVRVTVLFWGSGIPEALKIVEPIPAGFELVDEDEVWYAETDVRDAEVIHYVVTEGAPMYFRYYIRAESDGDLVALPATVELVRKPSVRGQSNEVRLRVKGDK